MKITCQSCQAKYTIADEKVAGKTVKIKCKKCGATIVVNGSDGTTAALQGAPQQVGPSTALAAAPPGGGGEEDEGDGATRVFAEGGPLPGASDEWTVNIADNDQRTLSSPQLAIEYQRGVVRPDTYVWKDGMADWLPLSAIPELMQLVSAARPGSGAFAASPPVAASGASGASSVPVESGASAPAAPEAGLGSTMIMPERSPLAASPAASPAAARRSSGMKAPAVDLFGAGPEPASGAAGAAASHVPSGDRQLGERNENSVLFSISALTASANAGKAKGDRADPFDLGPTGPAKRGRGNVDDIMNLGGGLGGLGGAPALAPPPLLTPLIEAPPPPVAPAAPAPPAPGVVAAASPGSPAMSAVPAMRVDQFSAPAPKSKAPIIAVALVAVLGVGGAGAYFGLAKGSAGSAAPESTTSTASPSAKPSAAPSAAPSSATTAAPAATTAAPSEAATAAPVAAGDTSAPTTGAASSGSSAGTTSPNSGKPTTGGPATGPGPSRGSEARPDSRVADARPAEPPKADPTPPPDPPKADPPKADQGGSGGKEFDRAAALTALSGAASGARACKKDDGPTGSAHVRVTFATNGSVTSSSVDPPFGGTPVGSCIAAAFRGVHVAPFDGSPITVPKTVTIN